LIFPKDIKAGIMNNRESKEQEVYPEIDEIFQNATLRGLDDATFLSVVYTRALPLIKTIIRKYIKIDTINDETDFLQQAYPALVAAARKYRQEASETRFSTVFVWYLQKDFEKLCPMNERQVEITYPDGISHIISYAKYLKIKKTLSRDTETRVVTRYLSLDQMIEDGEEKAIL
jgi:hypothetical protein